MRTRTSSNTQLYKLDLAPAAMDLSADLIFEDAVESGDLSAWTTYRDGGGQLTVGPGGALDGREGLQVLLGNSASSYVAMSDSPHAIVIPSVPGQRFVIADRFSRAPIELNDDGGRRGRRRGPRRSSGAAGAMRPTQRPSTVLQQDPRDRAEISVIGLRSEVVSEIGAQNLGFLINWNRGGAPLACHRA